MDLIAVNTTDFSNSRFFKPISVTLGGLKNRDSTVSASISGNIKHGPFLFELALMLETFLFSFGRNLLMLALVFESLVKKKLYYLEHRQILSI